ncbi:MAG: hypothetical protein H5T60_07980 [Anaerolineae bacterium]|nr:hypothetical protein [Anaerolineae bacterium]
MKRILPTVAAMVVGIIVLIDFFVDVGYINLMGRLLVDWAVILAAFALILGVLNLFLVHFRRIRTRHKGWPYSIILILTLWTVLVLGLLDPAGPQGQSIRWIFQYVQYPLQAAFFALTAIFILTAIYRTFRLQRGENAWFILAGILVLLGATAVGGWLWDGFASIREWIMNVPALAGARGILIGVALAASITGLRLLLGMDRPYAE